MTSNKLYTKKNKSVTITISHSAYNRLEKIADGYKMPTFMRMVLEASSEHKGSMYNLFAKMSSRRNSNDSF